jgi:glutathione S-transferase
MITVYVLADVRAPVRTVMRDLRALWALEESGLPYRIERLAFARGALDDGGLTLFESAAIVLHVAEKAGHLLPGTPEARARARQWAIAAVNTVEPAIAELYSIDALFAGQPWVRRRRPAVARQVQRRIGELDRELARRAYLLGSEFSAPDILMATVLRLAQADLLAAAPNAAAYLARCEARPAWTKVLAEHPQRLAA